MPNWVNNTLTADGLSGWDIWVGRNKDHFSFNTIKPMPPVLRRVSSVIYGFRRIRPGASNTQVQKILESSPVEFAPYLRMPFPQGARLARRDAEMVRREPKLTEAWYYWRLINWGCKWDASEGFREEGVDSVEFMTPWTPPTAIVEELSRQHPDTPIYHTYVEPGLDFAGSTVYLGGEVQESEETAYWGVVESVEE